MNSKFNKTVGTKLDFIGQCAAKEPDRVFTSLIHHVNEESLRANFYSLGKNRAVGVDEVSWQEYEAKLDGNIASLMERMKRMGYRPQPARRVYIPKGKDKLRPLGLPATEDKIVQKSMSRILEAIYEQDFYDCSYGFRPRRSCHQALKRVGEIINFEPINHVIEADIKGYFDNVSHEKLVELMRRRINDKKFLRYIVRFIKAGYVEREMIVKSKKGTPQGGNLSPMLANIFLHYVLDEWFVKELKPQLRGRCKLVRYCDDFVILVQYKDEAGYVMNKLQERFGEYELELNAKKSGVKSFGKYEKENAQKQRRKANTFDFLGFTHYCALTRNGKFKVSRRTSGKRLRRSLKSIYGWLKGERNCNKIREIWDKLESKMRGHYQYYGVSENIGMLNEFYHHVTSIVFKLLNRRSHKKSFSWKKFRKYLKRYPLPRPHIVHSFYK